MKEEIKQINSKFDNGLNDLINEQENNKEKSFQLNKSKEQIQRWLDVFDELRANYSLPDDITNSIDKIQDDYFDLFIGINNPSQKESNNIHFPSEEEKMPTISSEILESYDEYLPVKDNELEESHL